MTAQKSLRELMSLKGRVAVITGGAGHIGSAVADGLAELGASIALIDMNRERGEAVASADGSSGPGLRTSWFDGLDDMIADIGGVDGQGRQITSEIRYRIIDGRTFESNGQTNR